MYPNLKTLSTTALIARLTALETAIRFSRRGEESQLSESWARVRDELDSRPTCEVLAALG